MTSQWITNLTKSKREKPSEETKNKLFRSIDDSMKEGATPLCDSVEDLFAFPPQRVISRFYKSVYQRWSIEERKRWTDAVVHSESLGRNHAGRGTSRIAHILSAKLKTACCAAEMEPELRWLAQHKSEMDEKCIMDVFHQASHDDIRRLFEVECDGWGNEKQRLIALFTMMMNGNGSDSLQSAFDAFIQRINASTQKPLDDGAEPGAETEHPLPSVNLITLLTGIGRDIEVAIRQVRSDYDRMIAYQQNALEIRKALDDAEQRQETLRNQISQHQQELHANHQALTAQSEQIQSLQAEILALQTRNQELDCDLATIQNMFDTNVRQELDRLRESLLKELQLANQDILRISKEEPNAFDMLQEIVTDVVSRIVKKCTRGER